MLSNDVKLQNVMRMMGHKKIQQTLRYAKVIAKDVQDDYGMIAEKLGGKKKAEDYSSAFSFSWALMASISACSAAHSSGVSAWLSSTSSSSSSK